MYRAGSKSSSSQTHTLVMYRINGVEYIIFCGIVNYSTIVDYRENERFVDSEEAFCLRFPCLVTFILYHYGFYYTYFQWNFNYFKILFINLCYESILIVLWYLQEDKMIFQVV